jgi:hypothetical protein
MDSRDNTESRLDALELSPEAFEELKASDPRLWDLLNCEGCGQEISIPIKLEDKVTCPICGRVNNKSNFLPLSRTLWVSKKRIAKLGQPTDTSEIKCNLTQYYRLSIRLRRAAFGMYLRSGSFSYTQLVQITTVASISVGKAMSLLNSPKSEQVVTQWNTLKRKLAGHPPSDTTLVLILDAMLLGEFPNSYRHLLRDALILRLHEIKKTYKTEIERQLAMEKCVKWAVVTSKRAWTYVYKKEPEKPERNWWQRPARMQNPLEFRPAKDNSVDSEILNFGFPFIHID